MRSNKKVYWIVLLFCIASYSWLGYNFVDHEEHDEFTVCMIKNITGVPCPSCGITRSVIQLLHGNFLEAILINPLGLLAVAILLILPFWIMADFYFRKESLAGVFNRGELLLKSKSVYLPLILLCLVNWYWNILKGL